MKSIAAICLVIAALTANGPTSVRKRGRIGDEDVRECYQDSHYYERSQDYHAAIEALLPVFERNRRGYTVNLRLGWLHYLSGDYANAESYYRTAIKTSSDSIEAKLGYTLPLMAQGRYQRLEFVTKQILRADQRNYYGSLRLGFALRMQGKHSSAEKVIRRMLRLYPTDVSFLTELAFAKLAQGRASSAKVVFGNVLKLDPDNWIAKQQLGLDQPTGRGVAAPQPQPNGGR